MTDGSDTLVTSSDGRVLADTKGLPLFAAVEGPVSPTLKGHLEILRVDHWFKNVFVVPGIAVAVAVAVMPAAATGELLLRTVLGIFATCLVASSNYVLNEVLDAPYDNFHRTKCRGPVPSGRVHIGIAYAQWLALMIAGIGLGWLVVPGAKNG